MLAQPTLETLIEANTSYYRTFETLDIDALISFWEVSDRVYCVHPGWNPLSNYEKIIASWKRILGNTTDIHFTLSNVHAYLADNVGVVTLVENIRTKIGHEQHTAASATTNLFGFDLTSGLWKIFHHHASNAIPNPNPPPDRLN